MRKEITAAAVLAALVLPLHAATLDVEIVGPGGHSNGSYGNTSAVHAAARAVMEIDRAVPEAMVTGMKGGATVNSIAADARFTVAVSDEKAFLVEAAVKAGCEAENSFRGVKPGEADDNGLRKDIRWKVERR